MGVKSERILGMVICAFLFATCLFFPFFSTYGAQHIVLYSVGEKDPVTWTLLKRHLTGKGFMVSAYEGADSIEKQIELANKINKLRASLLLAVDFKFDDEVNVMVAVANGKTNKEGQVLTIEEVPAIHGSSSRELALLVAESFHKKVLELPLFPLLGIDTPGIFLEIRCPKDEANETLGKISESIQKYFGKGMKK